MRERPPAPPDRLAVLLVEDNPADARLVRALLEELPAAGLALEWARSRAQALERLAAGGVDVLLTDLNLPESRGLETFRALKARHPRLPIVVLTGIRDDPSAVSAVAEGAQDYLAKADLSGPVLARMLRFAVERGRLERFKEEFLQNVGHELRTPLSVAYAALKSVLDCGAGELPPDQREVLAMALRNTARLAGLIEDLADCTRAREGLFSVAPRRAALGALAREAASELSGAAAAAGVRLTAEAGPCPDAYADPRRLRQVLMNLVGNALKFTPAGGSVRVSAGRDPDDPGRLRLSVRDTGRGMEPQTLARVFDRLYQGRAERGGKRGLGLGLYICRQLVALQGGRLWAESAPGRGSAFHFTVPAFVLEDWLKPLASGAGPLWLASVELWPASADLSPGSAEELSREAGAALAAALPEAVLLPETAPPGEEGSLFLAARTRKPLKRDILRRAGKALAGCPGLKARGLAPAVSCAALPLPAGDFLPAAAQALDRALRAALARRRAAAPAGPPVLR